MMDVRNISKSYGQHQVIKTFSYHFELGRMYAIVGPSGSGKSTLVNMFGLLEKPDSGTLTIDGHSQVKPSSRQAMVLRRKTISYMFQNYALIPEETVQYNLSLVLDRHDKQKKEKMLKVLDQVGLDLSLKEKVFTLSGGQQQRVALARILLRPGKIILADEPTGNLDAINRDRILAYFKKLKEGRIIIIVTHDQEVAQYCDDIISLA